MQCPCCFQELPEEDRVTVSLENNVLIWSDLYANLSPTQAEMMYVLANDYPAWVDGEKLMTQVYGHTSDAPDSGYKVFSVMACKIRDKMVEADMPLTIETGWALKQGPRKYRIRHL